MIQVADKFELAEINSENKQRPSPGPSTLSVHGNLQDRAVNPNHALITPIMQTATYTFENTADLCNFQEAKMWGGTEGRREYGRYGNPTVRAVEKRIAALENGDDALLFPSGMTAVTHTLLSILPSGSHVIFTDDCYRKTQQFCHTFLARLGIASTEVPMGDSATFAAALEAAIQPNTRIIISESPPTPTCAWWTWSGWWRLPNGTSASKR
jgi:cystathionine gamma-synthase